MRKAIKLLAISTVGITVLAGCGGAPSTPQSNSGSTSASDTLNWDGTSSPSLKGQTITLLWTDTSGTSGTTAKLLKQFTKETGINVKEIGVDYNSVYGKVMTSALSNSSDIDVAEMDTIWAGQYYKGNIAVDLTNVVPKSVQSGFTQSSLSSVSYENHLMAIPWYSSTLHFYWNKTLFKKAGLDPSKPPKTWDEFKTDSEIIQKKLGGSGDYASGWSFKQTEELTCDYVTVLGGFGGQFFDSNNQPLFNSGQGVKALQYLTGLMNEHTIDPGSLQWTGSDLKNAFETGKIAMMINWDDMYPDLNSPSQSSVVNQTDVGLVPGEGSVVSAACTGSEGVAIMKTSKHKEASLAFLKWLGSKDYQLPQFTEQGHYPALQSLYTDSDFLKASDQATVNKIDAQFQYGFNRPSAPGYVKWSDFLLASLRAALMNQESPQKALDTAASQIKTSIQNANS